MDDYYKNHDNLSLTANRLKNLSLRLGDKSLKLKKISELIEDGWKGHQALEYLSRYEEVIRKISATASQMDEISLIMNREIQE